MVREPVQTPPEQLADPVRLTLPPYGPVRVTLRLQLPFAQPP
ncbi:MAG: hypothetical protein ACO1NY_09705 [Pseudorhodoplanes sp.]